MIALSAAVLFVASVRVTHAFFFDFTDIGIFIFTVIADLLQMVVNFIGALIAYFMTFFVAIAQYDDFATAPAVTQGWVLIRDISNMLIVLSLLVIAFMSAFDSGRYGLTKSLGQLIAVAILVNFSKTITLFAISISQVIMLSFVNAFATVGQGNLFQILGLERVFDVAKQSPGSTQFAALAAMLFTVVILIIVLGVIIALSMTFLVRVIVFWFLLVLSPLAIAMYAVPFNRLKKIKDKWTEELVNWLVLGPMLAFFIWLTFVSLKGASTVFQDTSAYAQRASEAQKLGEFAAFDTLTGYIIAVAMLLMGIKFSTDIAGTASSVFSKSLDATQKGGKLAARGGLKFAGDATIGLQRYGEAAGRALSYKTTKDEQGNIVRERRRGALGLAGRGLSAVTGATGAGVRGVSRAGEAVEKFAAQPGALTGALYRKVVRAERGAVESKSAELEQKLVDDRQKEIKEQGRSSNESKLILDEVKTKGRKDMTSGELMAEFKVARENGAVQSEDDFLQWMNAINESAGFGGQKQFVKEFEVAQRKDFFKEGSIFREQDQEYAVTKTIPEQFRSLDHREVFKNTKVYELGVDDYFEKDKDGKRTNTMRTDLTDTEKDAFARKKVAMLSYDENSVSLNDSAKSKEALRKHLEKLKETGDLTDEDLEKANRLIAATAISGAKAQKHNGSMSAEIDNLMSGQTSSIASTRIDSNELQAKLKAGKAAKAKKVDDSAKVPTAKQPIRTPQELASFVALNRPGSTDDEVISEVEEQTGERLSKTQVQQVRLAQDAQSARKQLFEEASKSSAATSTDKIREAFSKFDDATKEDLKKRLGVDIENGPASLVSGLADQFKSFQPQQTAAKGIQSEIVKDLQAIATKQPADQEAALQAVREKIKELAKQRSVPVNQMTGLKQLEGHLADLMAKRGHGGASFNDQVNTAISNITSGTYTDIAPDAMYVGTAEGLREVLQASVSSMRTTDPSAVLDTLDSMMKDAQRVTVTSADDQERKKAQELITRVQNARMRASVAARRDPALLKGIIKDLEDKLQNPPTTPPTP